MLASSLYMIQLSLIDIIKFLEILIDVQYVVCRVNLNNFTTINVCFEVFLR